MAWINERPETAAVYIFVFLTSLLLPYSAGLECGFPGSPAFGRPVPVRESYYPGSAVTYTCAHGYTLKGNYQKTCLGNGTWTDVIPICDKSLSGMDQRASSRAIYSPQYGAELSIDGDRTTCAFTDPSKPRYIRIELQNNHLVEAVAVTVPQFIINTDVAHFIIYVISLQNSTTSGSSAAVYHKCAEFNGKFSTTTVKLPCATGGVYGKYVHIEDRRNIVRSYFAICEIDVFVQKDSYECGEPDRPSNSYTSNPEAGVVEYRCVYGYKLEGAVRRRCLPDGQWSGKQPLCIEIVCPPLPPASNGVIQYSGPVKGKPVQGTTANVTCDYGYRSSGLAVICLESGLWSEGELKCQPVDCLAPKVRNELERYILLNGSTTYGSLALLYCGEERPESDETSSIRVCREDGVWSDTTIDCTTHDELETLGLVEEDEAIVPNGVIIGMAVVVFILLIILIFILLFRRKQLSRRQSTESLPSKDTSSSLSTSEVKNGIPYENDAFYASIPMGEAKHRSSNVAKSTKSGNDPHPVVERGILSTILFAKRKASNNEKQKPRSESTSSSSGTCFYEEIGLRSSGRKSSQQAKKATNTKDNACTQPVYAQVDYNEKRRSRLAKSTPEHSGMTIPRDLSLSNGETGTYHSEETPCYDSELDSEPVILRELPPIPDDDDQSSGTYASLSRPPEPPSPPSPIYMRDNAIYGEVETPYEQQNHQIMKENDVYSVR